MPGSRRVTHAVSLYLVMMFIVVVAKPAYVFRADGRVRYFGAGAGPDTSVFAGVVTASACAAASVLLTLTPPVARAGARAVADYRADFAPRPVPRLATNPAYAWARPEGA